MRLTTDFTRGFCIGMGLIGVMALAALRGFPNPRSWRAGRAGTDRAALDRAIRHAQEAPDYLDVCRAAGL
jgi:hypothetical protein